jgi:hypothetical protein
MPDPQEQNPERNALRSLLIQSSSFEPATPRSLQETNLVAMMSIVFYRLGLPVFVNSWHDCWVLCAMSFPLFSFVCGFFCLAGGCWTMKCN